MDVWLVEDDDLVSIPFTMWIERLGHTVTVFRRANEVILALDDQPRPAMVITDMSLPGMNGVELIDQVRAMVGNHLPAILISGHDIEARELSIGEPFAFIPKPVDLDRLQETIERFLGNGREGRA